MRGRRPKPTKLKVVTGNPGKRALPKDEPMPEGKLGEAPDHLNDREKAIWDEIREAGNIWLTDADGIAVEMLSCLLSEARVAFLYMPTARISQIVRLCSMLGLTPADRARISAPKKPETNPNEAFFGT